MFVGLSEIDVPFAVNRTRVELKLLFDLFTPFLGDYC